MRKIVVNFESVKYPADSLKDIVIHKPLRVLLPMAIALVLLGVYAGWNYLRQERSLHPLAEEFETTDREQIPDTAGLTSRRLFVHDFESGNAADTATHLASSGHTGKQSLELSSKVPYSPGLWIKFKDLPSGDSLWIRATGYVWFSCPAAEAKCSLVATSNHNGINYKYMAIPIEKEPLKPGQWNRISIDYLIPFPPDREDVVQVYFWYRGKGLMLVDDIEVELFGKGNHLVP